MKTADERRDHERFDMALPCLMFLQDDNAASGSTEHRVRDISAGGAFLNFSNGSRVGDFVRMEIVIPPYLISGSDGDGAHICAEGYVVRTEPVGIAVSFKGDYRISSLGQVLRSLEKRRTWLNRQRESGLERLQSDPQMLTDEGGNVTHKEKNQER